VNPRLRLAPYDRMEAPAQAVVQPEVIESSLPRVWVRGILQHEYGVDFNRITWVEGGVNESRPADREMDLHPLGGLKLEMIGSETCRRHR